MLTTRVARASILTLPPHLRVAAYQQSRSFSASAPRKLTLVDIAVAGPTALIDTLHSTAGLPWYAVLPTAAILVRGMLVYYLSALPARRAAQVQSSLVPLASARTLHKLNNPAAQQREQVLPAPLKPLSRMIRAFWERNVELHRLGKQFGAPKFHPRGVLNFGMLIAFTEAIRMKCNSREGLLPLVLSPFEAVARTLYPDRYPAAPVAPEASAEPDEEALQAATTADEDGMTSIDLSRLRGAEEPSTHVYSAYFDPTLKDEGFSWCMDLTAPDPTLLLPTALALTMATNIIFRPTAGRPKTSSPPPLASHATPTSTQLPVALPGAYDQHTTTPITSTPGAPDAPPSPDPRGVLAKYLPPITNLQRIGLCITILFWFAALKMPAAILLYFVPSLIVGALQRRWLDRKVPVLPPVQPCRRPLRYKVRKEWVD
ncbi:hypothetical protein LTR85_006672 [Meristemomyces frigidus]|nr:hypothetical protein LTR85_006672 [Meristemomyces frigidus]